MKVSQSILDECLLLLGGCLHSLSSLLQALQADDEVLLLLYVVRIEGCDVLHRPSAFSSTAAESSCSWQESSRYCRSACQAQWPNLGKSGKKALILFRERDAEAILQYIPYLSDNGPMYHDAPSSSAGVHDLPVGRLLGVQRYVVGRRARTVSLCL